MTAQAWVDIGVGEPTLDELPYAVMMSGGTPHLCVGVGSYIFDLHRAANVGLFQGVTDRDVLMSGSLNPLLEGAPSLWSAIRGRIVALLSDDDQQTRVAPLLVPRDDVELVMPWQVADYVDFYSSHHHVQNVGRIFRPEGDPEPANWRYLPMGYHGRSGTVVVSGTDIVRPAGITDREGHIEHGPSAKLDIEVELGFVLGHPTPGPVPVNQAPNHVFGVVILNDWSARDIQSFEYRPLGPFLGKSFATSVSAWVLPFTALSTARVSGPEQTPRPLPHLRTNAPWGLDISMDAWLRRDGVPPHRMAHVNARELYWTVPQQIAHLTSNGTPIRAGDLLGSGTISTETSAGSLLELTEDGRNPLSVDSSKIGYLEDGDEVVITASANCAGRTATLGEVRGRIVH